INYGGLNYSYYYYTLSINAIFLVILQFYPFWAPAKINCTCAFAATNGWYSCALLTELKQSNQHPLKNRWVIWRAALGQTRPQLSKPLCHNPLPPVRKGRQISKAAKLR